MTYSSPLNVEGKSSLHNVADLLVAVAVLRDGRAGFDMKLLDAHLLSDGHLCQVHAVDCFDCLTGRLWYFFHAQLCHVHRT